MTWRDGGTEWCRISSWQSHSAACQIILHHEANCFCRHDSTQAALSRLSCPGEENIKLVPAAYSRCSRARPAMLRASIAITCILRNHPDSLRSEDRIHVCFVSKWTDARCRLHHPPRKRSVILHTRSVYCTYICLVRYYNNLESKNVDTTMKDLRRAG